MGRGAANAAAAPRAPPAAAAWALAASLFLTTLGAFALLGAVDGSWESWAQATCLPDSCFCERPRDGLLRQPSNTFSNLGFTATGALVLIDCLALQSSKAIGRRAAPLGGSFGLAFGLANIVLGAGSGWYHASLTFWGQWIDNAAMYLLITAPLLFVVEPAQQRPTTYTIHYVTSNAFLGWLCMAFPATRRYIFLALVLVLLAAEVRARSADPLRCKLAQGRNLGTAAATLVVAFAIWTADLRGWLCSPESVFQGHAVWHLLNAVASFYLYKYYRPLAFGRAADDTPVACTIV